MRKYAREHTPATLMRMFYWRLFLKILGFGFLGSLALVLTGDLRRGERPALLRTLLWGAIGTAMVSLSICAVTWLSSFLNRFVDLEIRFCEDHLQYVSAAGVVRLKYMDVRLCRFRTMTVGEQQIAVMEIQTADGFAMIELHPSVARADIERVLKQKQIMAG